MQERVVITGLGTVNPTGLSVLESWQNVISGVSGIKPTSLFDASHLPIRIAGEVKGFNPTHYMTPPDARRRDRFEQLGVAAAKEAVAHAGLEITEENAPRIGVIISSTVGGLTSLQNATYTYRDEGLRRVTPFIIPMLMSNGAAGMTSIDLNTQGPSLSVASACASGADGIGIAWTLLRAGVVDVVLAGASEAVICEISVVAFDRSGAVSLRNDHTILPQPFDLNRDGLVMSEGAAVLTLERESHARKRGANILAEVAGYGSSADAYHITAPVEDGSVAARAMRQALDSAEVNLEDIDYINAHGTGTVLNDVSETKAIKFVFGDLAYRVPVSSTKSMTGHMMGATAALEAVFCVKVIQEGILPPTIHYQTPDPQCDLDYVPNQARDKRVKVVMSNSFGFGGHNAVLVFRAYT